MALAFEKFSEKQWLLEHQQLFSQQIQSSTLPHALLITGMAGSGKQTLATWLVNVLLCQQSNFDSDKQIFTACNQCKSCQLQKSKTYPDQLTVSTESKSIGVEDIRKAGRFLEKTAQIGQLKTVMIPEANKMTISAANALLKTLEEPSATSMLILLTSDVDTLLPTIISRCRLIALRPPVGAELLRQVGKDKNNHYVNLTQLPEILDENIHLEYQYFENVFITYLSTGNGRLELLEKLQTSQHASRWLEKITSNLMREQYQWLNATELDTSDLSLEIDVNKAKLKKLINQDTIWVIYQLIQHCVRQLKSLTQVNAQFSYEKLLIDIMHAVNHTQEIN